MQSEMVILENDKGIRFHVKLWANSFSLSMFDGAKRVAHIKRRWAPSQTDSLMTALDSGNSSRLGMGDQAGTVLTFNFGLGEGGYDPRDEWRTARVVDWFAPSSPRFRPTT